MRSLAAPQANRPREVYAGSLRVACVGRARFTWAPAAAALLLLLLCRSNSSVAGSRFDHVLL